MQTETDEHPLLVAPAPVGGSGLHRNHSPDETSGDIANALFSHLGTKLIARASGSVLLCICVCVCALAVLDVPRTLPRHRCQTPALMLLYTERMGVPGWGLGSASAEDCCDRGTTGEPLEGGRQLEY